MEQVMIEPFGAILNKRYQLFQRIGFQIVNESDYSTILRSTDKIIALTVERYTPADIQLSFIGQKGEIYPLWMVRLIVDMDEYDKDKIKLHSIKDEYGLRDGSKGGVLFRRGVKVYTSTYIELATIFLRENIHRVNFDEDKFKSGLVQFTHH